MSDPVGGFVIFGGIVLILLFGVWAGTRSYQHDTFDCTRACGAHSIQYNQKCYCEDSP